MGRTRTTSAFVCALLLPLAALPAQGQPQEVTFTTTADFRKGNPEGLVSLAGDQITRTALNAGPLGTFSQGTALSIAQIYHSSVYCNGYVYNFGGGISTGPFLTDVVSAPVTNGSVGAWTSTQSLPVGNRWHASVAYNGFVYVIGGVDAGPTTTAAVRMAALNDDGTVGSWTTATALPSARYGHSAVVHGGHIFVIGGLDGSSANLADAIVARINADGTLGDWNPTTPLPSARHSHAAASFNGYMYVAGGSASFTPGVAQLPEVYVAAIGSSGTLGPWTTTTPLPSGRAKLGLAAVAGHLYSLGGFDGSPYALPNAVAAPITADGTLGAWSESPTVPISPGYYAFGLVVVDGAVITTGGYAYSTGSPLWRNEVLINTPPPDTTNSAQVLPLLKGEYSHIVDLGSERLVNGIEINGSAPSGGKVKLQYRLASSTNPEFGAEQVVNSFPLGSGIAIPGSARWVWIRLTLDDTGRTDSPASITSNPTVVTDFTIGGVSSLDKPKGLAPSGKVSVISDAGGPVQFEWSALTQKGLPVPGATYEFQVSSDPAFPTPLVDLANLAGTSTSVEMHVSKLNEVYSWRVRGADPSVPGAMSPWSDPLTFSVSVDDGVDHGGGDCTVAARASPGGAWLSFVGLLILLGAWRIRQERVGALGSSRF